MRALKLSGKAALGLGALEAIAVLFLTTGAQQIQGGNYLVGGAMCAIGFVLLVVDRYVL
jgi:hypothetical protein